MLLLCPQGATAPHAACVVWPAESQQGQPVFMILSGERWKHIVKADVILCMTACTASVKNIYKHWEIIEFQHFTNNIVYTQHAMTI